MSNLFGGLFSTAGEAGLLALRRELETRRNQWVSRPGDIYRGGGDLILRHGKFFKGRELPDQYTHLHGEPAMCFVNATRAAKADPTLRLFEGVYTDQGHFTAHGWCVAPDGGVLELTYPTREDQGKATWRTRHANMTIGAPERIAYAGIEVHPDLAKWHLARFEDITMLPRPAYEREEMAAIGMDGSQDHDFEILKHPYDPDRRSF